MYKFLEQAQQSIHVQLWIENASGEGFGSGIINLLHLIHELGSLNKAAKSLGMSYRAAWGKLKKTEEILGVSLVETSSKRSGHKLSSEARILVQTFQLWQLKVQDYATLEAQKLFVSQGSQE